MNQKYDYNAWKDRLDELQNWWGKRFELQLEEFFTGLPTKLRCHAVTAGADSPVSRLCTARARA